MFRHKASLILTAAGALASMAATASAQNDASTWTFAVSGDSRNCGDFVMPAIAVKVKAEKDAFYWHLGDFRAMSGPDQDWLAMDPAHAAMTKPQYQEHAWDDFIEHQLAAFEPLPVFLGRGNHEDIPPMTRDDYIAEFASYLIRPEIVDQRKADGNEDQLIQPWYHWIHEGIDFITLDSSSHDEFSDDQLKWFRAVLDRDLDPKSGVRTIVAGMHEALPHSTTSNHAMDDWDLGIRTGELVYNWLYDAQAAGKRVYIIASHSHFYSPNSFNTAYWKQHSSHVVPGLIIGAAGAHRYKLPPGVDKASLTDIYGYVQGAVHADGTIDFTLHQLSEDDLKTARWPNAPLDAIHECYVGNSDNAERK